ncbi:MAG TPA: MFS transporter [Rhodocyclaceae bacterium]
MKAQTFALGSAQTLAWAASAYLPAVIGMPMASDLGTSGVVVYAAYSVSLLVTAALGPAVGRAIDRRGGRGVLCVSNIVLAAGLVALSRSSGIAALFAAWILMGAGMALGLYDSAFAALVRQHGARARRSITGITLIAGFASTIGWPLTSAMAAAWDWRAACVAWAAAQLLVALPLNWFALRPADAEAEHEAPHAAPHYPPGSAGARRAFWLVAVFGAATSFVTSAMAAHLPGLLQALGLGIAAAVGAGALVGPAQVVARALEFVAGNRLRVHPLVTARSATILHPVGALALLSVGAGPWGGAAFAVLHGAGNGLLTIAKGTLPLAIFGPAGYGARLGFLAVSQRGMQAAAPLVISIVLERWGGGAALLITGGLSLVALGALAGIALPDRHGAGRIELS